MTFRLAHNGFKGRTILILGVVQLLLMMALFSGGAFYYYMEETGHVERQANNMVNHFAKIGLDAVISNDLATLGRFSDSVLTSTDAVYIRIKDSEGKTLIELGDEGLLKQPFVRDISLSDALSDHLYDIDADILFDGQKYGQVEMGMDVSESMNEMVDFVWFGASMCILVLATMILTLSILLRFLTRRLDKLKEAFFGLIQGEASFDTRIEMEGEDEFAQIAIFFDMFMGQLEAMVQQILYVANELSLASQNAQNITTTTSQNVEAQAQAIAEFTHDIRELSCSSEIMNQKISTTLEETTVVQQEAETGGEVVKLAMEGMQELESGVNVLNDKVGRLASHNNDIGNALATIATIAGQTNLLALNAAIEAARAGDHGRGFAVVADEVRKLAEKTTQATTDIQQLLEGMQSDSEQAVETMQDYASKSSDNLERVRKSGIAFASIAESVGDIQRHNQESSEMAHKQHDMANHIHARISDIDENIKDLSDMARKNISDNGDLSQFSIQLSSLVGNVDIQHEGINTEDPVDEVELF